MEIRRLLRLRAARLAFTCLLSACSALAQPGAAGATAAAPAQRLRVVGSLAGVSQYTRHEEPFWSTQLARLSGGRYSAEIVPFDRAGIRGQEVLQLVQLGALPIATVLLALSAPRDLELSAPDLAGLNPDMATLRRSVAAFRPHLESVLRKRYGVALLAVYTYPAQVLFCKQGWSGLADLKGRRVRTSGATQSDWVEALGALPVTTAFAEILTHLRTNNTDCAITGTMSGNTIGLYELTTHIQPLAVTWGLSILVANGAAWAALPAELRLLLQRELPKLELAIWDEAQRDTDEGIACNLGAATCLHGRRGHMIEVRTRAADEQRRREIFASAVLPHWLQRCGPQCAEVWNRTLAPVAGVTAPAR